VSASDPLAAARAVLASPALHDELTRRLAEALLAQHAERLDFEDEADRAGAEVARRGEELRALGADVPSTEWDGPGVRPATRPGGK
jgi:hypothetical protein